MTARDPYGTAGTLGSPRAPTSSAHRASASPSIASLVDPMPSTSQHVMSTSPSQQTFHNINNGKAAATLPPRFHESASVPPSPSQSVRPPQTQAVVKPPKPAIMEVKRTPVPSAVATPTPQPKAMEPPKNNFTSMSTPPVNVLAGASSSAPAQNKKTTTVSQKEREKPKSSTPSSSTNANSLKDVLPGLPAASGRSILDFGKANPGEETQAPSIVLHIPLNGESNKVVNFMRMAEEAYGWDALHPRLAAHRERKARIAAASAELAKQAGGRESGDEMSDDLSDNENDASNVEMGGMGNGPVGGAASGPEGAPVKARKKRINKEDEYDKDDDFVDDSELMWEEQAAASRDGFFVYSGPLIPEEPKPAAGDAPAKRGRGRGGGPGSRGGRGGAARGEGTGRGRGGGPGSRGGTTTRKPRITKAEKLQREAEKEEREKLAQMTSKTGASTGTPYSLPAQLEQASATGLTL